MVSFFKKLFGGKEDKAIKPTPLAVPPPEPEPLRIREVSPQELKARMDNGDNLVIVDMRQTWEYQYGHIPGAVHMFVNEIPARVNELPPDAEIVFQCWHGNTSLGAAGYLIERGWPADRVASLRGGMAGWVQAHGPGSLEK